jgi:hypothetical protein
MKAIRQLDEEMIVRELMIFLDGPSSPPIRGPADWAVRACSVRAP